MLTFVSFIRTVREGVGLWRKVVISEIEIEIEMDLGGGEVVVDSFSVPFSFPFSFSFSPTFSPPLKFNPPKTPLKTSNSSFVPSKPPLPTSTPHKSSTPKKKPSNLLNLSLTFLIFDLKFTLSRTYFPREPFRVYNS